jgi:serine/threonine-protein kinase
MRRIRDKVRLPTGPQVGDRLGPYRLEEVLGQGGMGMVFRAVREPEGSVCALKVLRADVAADPISQKRFAHEVRAASEVTHRHLVPILDAGEIDGVHYLASAYVAGDTLSGRIRAVGPLPVSDIGVLTADVASALDALHAKGLVHRDVKPSNILLDESGDAMLTDFGLSRGHAYTALTQAGQVVGTLDYLAPELIRGAKATPASDIYALGCVVYEMLTGEPPFAHRSSFEVGVAHLEEDPPDPTTSRADVAGPFAWAVLQALNKAPDERPSTATMYANLLSAAARGGGT